MAKQPEGAGLRSGLRAIQNWEDLALRCDMEQDGDCWIWRGHVDDRRRIRVHFQGESTSMGQVIGFLRTGKRPTKAVWVRTCNSDMCCNPEHWGPSTMSAVQRRNPAANLSLRKLKVTIACRAIAKIDEEKARDIRESTEPYAVRAKRHGLSISHTGRIARGEAWKPTTLINSVFAIGEAL